MEAEEPAPIDGQPTEVQPVPAEPSGRQPTYWLRVHGYPGDLSTETVYYGDFGDLTAGQLPDDPKLHLQTGDVLVYYADGPGSLYGVATVTGDVEGPTSDPLRGNRWSVPIKREAIIRLVNKMPHAAGLQPPSGLHFLWLVRNFTYVRLPAEDGEYLVDAIKSRAGSKE